MQPGEWAGGVGQGSEMANRRFALWALSAALLAASAAAGSPQSGPADYVDDTPRTPDLTTCPTLSACLALVDAAAPAHGDGGMDEVKTSAAAAALVRFGEPAKQALLDRAAGRKSGLRNEAGALLTFWPTWSPADVPKLAAGLRLDHGGWLARPLGEIGGDEAIVALVQDLKVAGESNQTDAALAKIGPAVLPRIMPLLEQPEDSPPHEGAASVIRQMGSRAMPAARGWIAMAGDTHQPRRTRLAALAALKALGPAGAPLAPALRPLMGDPDATIARQARIVLVEDHDAAVATEIADGCRPSRAAFIGAPSASYCLFDLGRFQSAPEVAGPRIQAFLNSPNGDEAALAIRQLGRLRYAPAGGDLVTALSSSDWRVVYAAATSLGRLGPEAPASASPALRRVAQTHWLPEVRTRAVQVLAALDRRERFSPSDQEDLGGPIESYVTEEEARHPCSDWRWQGHKIGPDKPLTSLVLSTGRLDARDRGEWGGELAWTPKSGRPVQLVRDNFQALDPIGDGRVLALGGLAHMVFNFGYVVLLEPDGGGWRLREVARLPGQFRSLGVIGPDTYAAFSFKRVVVFNTSGIVGMASCAARD
jgi:hypothetical protein